MILSKLKKIFLKYSFRYSILIVLLSISYFIYDELFLGHIYNITPGEIFSYIGPMVSFPLIGYFLQERYEKSEELAYATDKISELMLKVVHEKQLGIRYENPYIIPCWEVKKCSKKECPAYKSNNLRCWQLAGTFCSEGIKGEMAKKLKDCRSCEVYKICTPSEITDIGEDFNNMMVMLEHMSSQQYQDFMSTIEALSKLIEMKDPYTVGRHCYAVQKYAIGVAKYLNLKPIEIENIKVASVLHDIGKIGIRGAVLNKNGPLDKFEYEEIKKHPLIGEDAIKSIEKLKDIRKIIRYHHERYDGKMNGQYSSYTGEVKGEEIPIEARIITLVDAYDAMTAVRPYRKALSKEDALEIIKRENGCQFDPKCVEAFFKYLKDEEVI